MGWPNIEPKSIQALNNWLGKPVVITCNEVTPTQLPHVFECV